MKKIIPLIFCLLSAFCVFGQDTILVKSMYIGDTIRIVYLYCDTSETEEDYLRNIIDGESYQARQIFWAQWELGYLTFAHTLREEGWRPKPVYLNRHKKLLPKNIIVWMHKEIY
jgi:hypothetical protein